MIKHLYDSFAERWYRGGSIWLYSDPHFNDPEMEFIRKDYISDEEQVKRINSKVGKNDTLIILGDIGDVEWVRRLRGYKVLIMGNHDKGASNYRHRIEAVDAISGQKRVALMGTWDATYLRTHQNMLSSYKELKLFDEVYEGALMISPKIILSHEPIADLPPFLYNIHGHDHSNWFIGGHHFNVCAEHNGYYPINLNKFVTAGCLADVPDIHRLTIDGATARKLKKGNH